MKTIALTIAGWDPSCGAGAAADLKTFAAWGAYGQAALTALTVQNTLGVASVTPVAPGILADSLRALAEDAPPAVIKIGMLGSADAVKVVAGFLRSLPEVPVILDPVLRSSSGRELLAAADVGMLRAELFPLVAWVTPNGPEMAALTGRSASTASQMEAAAESLQQEFPRLTVLATGGELEQPSDYLLLPNEHRGSWIPGEHVATTSTHGTGCTLASAIAVCMARWPEAVPARWVIAAKRYIEGALRHAPGIGRGAGPMEHYWRPVPASLEDATR